MVVHARIAADNPLLVQEGYDPAWRATEDGRELTVRRDVMGMMWVDAPPGERESAGVHHAAGESRGTGGDAGHPAVAAGGCVCGARRGAVGVTRRRAVLLDCLLLFGLFTVLLAPYYTHKFTDQWPSIESTFIAEARFLATHWLHARWQPLWYTGTRVDYVYPPALLYGTALLSKIFGWWTVKAYHFYTIFFYCVGIAGVYLLVRAGGRSRAAGWICALATAVMSPTLLLFTNMRTDAGPWHTPVRFGVLVRYGEGPHITALCLLPIALAFTWRALEARRPRALVLAGIFSAAVVSNNFYGATSLAMFYPLLVWSFAVTRWNRRLPVVAAAIPLAAYGLTAFWFTPSYLRVTLHNMQYVSEKGSAWSVWVAAAVALIFAGASWKLGKNRPERTWAVFVVGALVVFGLNVAGNYYWNFRVMGEPGRLIPELDLVIILAAMLACEWLWRRPGVWFKLAVAVVIVLSFATSRHFVRHIRQIVEPWPDYRARVEYRVTDWIWTHMPDARVNTSGSVRFWFDTWHDLAELGGGSEQGLLNPLVQDVSWEILMGSRGELARLWLQAMGTDAMYVAHANSENPYKDGSHFERFADWPVLYDDGQGNTLYGTGRRWAARARVVDTARIRAIAEPWNIEDQAAIERYVDAVENGPDSAPTVERPSPDEMMVHARLSAGQSLLVQETWDAGWEAWDGGRRLAVSKDAMGFLLVAAPAGERTIRLEFPMPLENRVGWGVTALTVAGLGLLAFRRRV